MARAAKSLVGLSSRRIDGNGRVTAQKLCPQACGLYHKLPYKTNGMAF
jgi:hypothetical protein